MDKKYIMLDNDFLRVDKNTTLYRIKALKSFNNVKKGDLGGFIEKESNLSHDGDCWIYDDAKVFDNARILDNAKITKNSSVSENATVYNEAVVSDDASVYGKAKIFENAKMSECSEVFGNAKVFGNARLGDYVVVADFAQVYELADIINYAFLYDFSEVYGKATVGDKASIFGSARVYDNAKILGNAKIFGNARVYDSAKVEGDVNVGSFFNVCGDSEITENLYFTGSYTLKSNNDCLIFKNTWSTNEYFAYIKSEKTWFNENFIGTSKELIENAYDYSEDNGKHYEAYVKFVKQLEELDN